MHIGTQWEKIDVPLQVEDQHFCQAEIFQQLLDGLS